MFLPRIPLHRIQYPFKYPMWPFNCQASTFVYTPGMIYGPAAANTHTKGYVMEFSCTPIYSAQNWYSSYQSSQVPETVRPTNKHNGILSLGQRHRRWPNLRITLVQRFVLTVSEHKYCHYPRFKSISPRNYLVILSELVLLRSAGVANTIMLAWCWASVADDVPALTQRCPCLRIARTHLWTITITIIA